ncbi:MAG: glycosyltransferase family 39 protein [Candidatus Schekmanbacteria bacterium]|nr:glycosyltransferase family 39 protein [Candidatus Schekmanbacteria bacterium]
MSTAAASGAADAPLAAEQADAGRIPPAWGLLSAFAAIKLVVHLLASQRYGYFRDELYYLASTGHLDWGYVDHPPLSIAVLAVVRAVLGDSLLAVRLVPIAAGVAVIYGTGLLAQRLGGGRFAQGLAALAALLSPVFLGTARYYSMNALDLLAWTAAALIALAAIERERIRDWATLGIVIGCGLLNKISMLWFVGGLAAGMVLTRHRRHLRGPGPWIAAGLAMAIFSPYVVWQVRHGWPTLDFMRNATAYKMAAVTPLEFVRDQVLSMNPGAAPIWVAGLAFGLFARAAGPGRVLALVYAAVFSLLVVSGHSRASYLAPAYPMLLALGGVALARPSRSRHLRQARVAVIGATIGFGAALAPLALPLLPVDSFVRYQASLGFRPHTEERHHMGPLPQHYADMFGWEEMVELVAHAYALLNPKEKATCRVFAQNYGEAGAVDVLGKRLGLPAALSGHNSYWLWGREVPEWDVVIIIGGDRHDNAEFFSDITIVGQTDSPWSMPYERGLDVSVARRPRLSLRDAWPRLQAYN